MTNRNKIVVRKMKSGEKGMFKGNTYLGRPQSNKKDKDKGVIYRLERLYEQAKDIASATGEAIADVYERLKKAAGFNEGGMPTQRKGNLDYRNSAVTNTVDNRKNK
mgnify:FL=1